VPAAALSCDSSAVYSPFPMHSPIKEAAIANCHGGMLRTHIEQHAPGRLEEITNAVAAVLTEKFGAGPIDAPMQAILFTASIARNARGVSFIKQLPSLLRAHFRDYLT